jgi:hypothetical protein
MFLVDMKAHPSDNILKSTADLKESIIKHPIYNVIRTKEDLAIFMQYHVYAVWDFMSLLKSLQRSLTCVEVPWLPKGDADTRFLINEIVVAEESDVDMFAARKSHFEMYLEAMAQAGADTSAIEHFINTLLRGVDVNLALSHSSIPEEARKFVSSTFNVIQSSKPHVMAAVFTFGREELIPGMFIALVNDLNRNFPNEIGAFKYYLDRHIEIDGGHHSHLALRMTENLCGNDAEKWQEAQSAVELSLKMRHLLWTGALHAIERNKVLQH